MKFHHEELISISALAQYAYCPRRCALVHIEMEWEDNIHTLRGKRLHETVDIPKGVIREDLRVERSLPVWSEALGIIGIADIVEFLPDGSPYPVEYKPGKKKRSISNAIQLCAYAFCLEEMFARPVAEGAIYYHSSRRRLAIPFNDNLRNRTLETIQQARALLSQTRIPPPVNDNRCPDCSLIETCYPQAPAILALEVSLPAQRTGNH